MNANRVTGMLIIAAMLACPHPAAAKQIMGLWDSNGKMLLPIKFDEIQIRGETIFVRQSQTDKNGITTHTQFEMSKTGKRLSQPHTVPRPAPHQAIAKSKFHIPEGWALSKNFEFGWLVTRSEGRERAFLDKTGKLIIFPTDQVIEPASAELFLKFTYPDDGGEVIQLVGRDFKPIATLPRDIRPLSGEFHEGLMPVRAGFQYIGFINTAGDYQIKPTTIIEAEDFRNGISAVEFKSRGGTAVALIDKNGNVTAGPYESSSFPFRFNRGEQFVLEVKNGKSGVIDQHGKEVIPINHDFMLEHGQKYVGRKEGQWRIYDRAGKLLQLLPKSTCYVAPAGDGLWLFAEGGESTAVENRFRGTPNPGSKFGLLDDSGKIVVPSQFSAAADKVDNDLLLVQTKSTPNSRWEVFNLKTKRIVFSPRTAQAFLQDGFIFASEESHDFDGEVWKSSRGNWNDFLYSYDLIGMSKASVEKLLGKSDGIDDPNQTRKILRYNHGFGSCGNSRTQIQIEFDSDERAIGWRDCSFLSEIGDWHRDNVVLIDRNGQPPRVVPKKEARTTAAEKG